VTRVTILLVVAAATACGDAPPRELYARVDEAPPRVVASRPEDGVLAGDSHDPIVVRFSEVVDAESLHPAGVEVAPARGVPGAYRVAWDPLALEAWVLPVDAWPAGPDEVSVTVRDVRDLVGRTLAEPWRRAFAVAAAPDGGP
jgi:hypothetical protein